MKLFLTVSFRATSSDLRNDNRINLFAVNYNIAYLICSSRPVHKERKIRKVTIFNKEIIFPDFLGLVSFKRFSDYFDFIAFVLIWFWIIMIKIKAFVLIKCNTALVKYFIQCRHDKTPCSYCRECLSKNQKELSC